MNSWNEYLNFLQLLKIQFEVYDLYFGVYDVWCYGIDFFGHKV